MLSTLINGEPAVLQVLGYIMALLEDLGLVPYFQAIGAIGAAVTMLALIVKRVT